MALDLEEQEQIDQLRAWWSKYGNLLMAILIVALSLMAAWRGWQWYQVHQAGQARGYFEALQDAASQQTGEESVARITAAVKTLRDDYANTEYATRGALIAATALEARKDTAGAQGQLEWVIRSGDRALVPVAKLRLAGLLLNKKEFDAALAALNDAPEPFAGVYADRRGDILVAQGQTSLAKTAWQMAIELLGPSNPLTSLVKLKLDALGV